MRAPRSTRGASGGVRRCGSGAVAAKGCNTHTRVAAAEAERSRRASRAPPELWVAERLSDAHRPRAAEAPMRWRGVGRESGERLKGQSTVGRSEQASNTARGTSEKWRTCG